MRQIPKLAADSDAAQTRKVDKVIRSKRRTIALIISLDGTITVRAPLRAANSQIQQFVQAKAGWIEKKLAEMEKRRQLFQSRQFRDGEAFYFFGGTYPLLIVEYSPRPLDLVDGRFILRKDELHHAREIFEQWYRRNAHEYLKSRSAELAHRFNLQIKHVRITSARHRWGSCSSKGTVNFSWRLIMAPHAVIDYVIIHELAHLREKNHSAKFWQVVESMLPDYSIQETWLKEFGGQLRLD